MPTTIVLVRLSYPWVGSGLDKGHEGEGSFQGPDKRAGTPMPMNLKFFYFGNQCPHNCYLLARIKTIAWREHVPIRLFDLTEDPRPAEEYRIFSPNMLLINDRYRLHGPFTQDRVHEMLDDEGLEPVAFRIKQSEDVVRGELIPLTPESSLSTSAACAGAEDEGLCRGKSEWARTTMEKYGLKHLGYLHLVGGKCVGGAEFLPSLAVPYPVPDKLEGNAFLTCSYASDAKADYRTHPLEGLIDDLRSWGYDTLSVAASTNVVFPNGPVEWFARKGFVDKGLLIREELHDADIHYLQLRL